MHDPAGVKKLLRRFSRRSFLQTCGALLGGAIVSGKASPSLGSALARTGGTQKPLKGERSPGRLIYIAIDALHPKYLELNSRGLPGGKDGDWLMPSIRAFLNRAVWYPEAKAYLPAATAASLMGLELRSTVIGQDLSRDLAG